MELKDFRQQYPYSREIQNHKFERVLKLELTGELNRLFEIVSNTSLVNKHLGIAPRHTEEVDGKLLVKTHVLGQTSKWIEHPWAWSYGKYMLVEREHQLGPMQYEQVVFHFEPSDQGAILYFYYVADIKSWFLKWIYQLIFASFGKKMQAVIQALYQGQAGSLSGQNNNLYHRVEKALKSHHVPENLQKFLAEFVAKSDEDELYRIQVPQLAAQHQLNQAELLGAFLKGVKAGIFQINWDIICPHCRGKRSRVNHLHDLLEVDECAPCQVRFQVDTLDKIDVSFTLNPDLKPIQEVSFCAAEPYKKPHIYFSNTLSAKERVELNANFEKAHYRLRMLGQEQPRILTFDSKASNKLEIRLSESSNFVSNQNPHLTLINDTQKDQTVIIESIEMPLYYLSPIHVFNHKVFKNLFIDERLNQGVQLKLPAQIILFTDVVGSTEFYQTVGDEQAYREIARHFTIIEQVLEAQEGIWIKSIGDAVMATFKAEHQAIEASQEIARLMEADEKVSFKLRFSMHKGPVIAVNYNSGVDYFGNHVNLSAKLQAIANANELAMSEDVYITLKQFYPQAKSRVYLDSRQGFVIDLVSSDSQYNESDCDVLPTNT